MFKLYALAVSAFIEFFILMYQLTWVRPDPQVVKSAQVGVEVADAFMERGVLGATTIMFFLTTGAAIGFSIKLIKDHRKESSLKSQRHEENMKELIKTHRVDMKDVTLAFSDSVNKSNEVHMKRAQNEAVQTKLLEIIQGKL
jgi:hypothetical protein